MEDVNEINTIITNFHLSEWIVKSNKKYITCLNAKYASIIFADVKSFAKKVNGINLVEANEQARQESIRQIVKNNQGSLPTRFFACPAPNLRKFNASLQMIDENRGVARLCIVPFYVSNLQVDDRRQFFEYSKNEFGELLIIDRVQQNDKQMDVSYWLHEVKLRYGEVLSFRTNETHEAILIYAKSKCDWRSDMVFTNNKATDATNNNLNTIEEANEDELTKTRRRVLAKSKSSLE